MSITPTSASAHDPRPLRADAQRNYDVLVATAAAEFAAHGANVALEDIARRANVGIGTLYRHFPTRDDLLAKVLNNSAARVLDLGKRLAEGPTPAANLFEWIVELAAMATIFRGLTPALANNYVTKTGTRLWDNCHALQEAGSVLLARAQAAGEVRADAQVTEIILSAHSAAWISEQTKDPEAVRRLLAILFDGLRVGAAAPAAAAAAAPAPAPKKRATRAPSSKKR